MAGTIPTLLFLLLGVSYIAGAPTSSDQACMSRQCEIECPYGHEVDSDGCPLCNCKPGAVSVSECSTSGMFCDIYCPHGMTTDAHGCPLCSCA